MTLADVSPRDLTALAVAISFAAGLNVYATVATLGLLARTHVIDLPPELAFVAENWIIGASGALFCLEFIADKVPFVDLLWNILQTFVRIPVAALLAYDATSALSPGGRLIAAMAGAAIAAAAHGGKIVARAAVTPSPEPVSNIALSFGEDVVAVTLTWFATQHPIAAAGIVLVCVLVLLLLARTIVRLLRRLIQQRRRSFAHPR